MAKKKIGKNVELIKLLQIVGYKEGSILIRQFPQDIYIWDVFFKGKFYSGYIVMKPAEGKTELDDEQLKELIKMLYAGAATTIDYQLGIKLNRTQTQMVEMFENGRSAVTGGD